MAIPAPRFPSASVAALAFVALFAARVSGALAADEEEETTPNLAPSVVKDVVLSHMPAIKHCYHVERRRLPDLAGKVSVRFTVSVKGGVTEAVVTETTLKNQAVESCIVEEVKSWVFPEPTQGRPESILFPFVFKAD